MMAETDIGGRKQSTCYVHMQVKDGEFVRVNPTEPGTFDCTGKPYDITHRSDHGLRGMTVAAAGRRGTARGWSLADHRQTVTAVAIAAVGLAFVASTWAGRPVTAQSILNLVLFSLPIAGIYALSATGLVVVYSTTGVFNFAQGAIGMMAAFVGWQLSVSWGLPSWIAFPLVVLVIAPLFGIGLDRILMRHLQGKTLVVQLMVTVGLLFGFIGLVSTIWDQSVGPVRAVPVRGHRVQGRFGDHDVAPRDHDRRLGRVGGGAADLPPEDPVRPVDAGRGRQPVARGHQRIASGGDLDVLVGPGKLARRRRGHPARPRRPTCRRVARSRCSWSRRSRPRRWGGCVACRSPTSGR